MHRLVRAHVLYWIVTYAAALALVLPFTTAVLGLSVAATAWSMLWWTALGASIASALLWAARRLSRHDVGARTVIGGALGAFAGALAWAAIAKALHGPLPALGPTSQRVAPPEFALCAIVLGLWAAVLIAVHQAGRVREERARSLELRALAAEAELHALMRELNPHLLFNALNAVIGAIDEDPDKAKDLVRNLSELLRQTLQATSRDATLGSELKLAQYYLAIQKMRFEDRLQVAWDVPTGMDDRRVPPMVLQPLLENAVKHGEPDGGRALRVGVSVRRCGDALEVEVSNSGRLVESRPDAVGLRNLRQRLERTYEAGASLDVRADRGRVVATLRLPEWPS